MHKQQALTEIKQNLLKAAKWKSLTLQFKIHSWWFLHRMFCYLKTSKLLALSNGTLGSRQYPSFNEPGVTNRLKPHPWCVKRHQAPNTVLPNVSTSCYYHLQYRSLCHWQVLWLLECTEVLVVRPTATSIIAVTTLLSTTTTTLTIVVLLQPGRLCSGSCDSQASTMRACWRRTQSSHLAKLFTPSQMHPNAKGSRLLLFVLVVWLVVD